MCSAAKRQGRIVVISGPSGVGKSTITRQIVERLDYAFLSVSVTTRPRSDKEVNGRDYWFVDKDEFQRLIDEDRLLEYAEVFGNLYGTPRDKVDEAIAEGKAVILEIDVQGALKTKKIYPDAVMIFIVPPTPKTLAERLNSRGRDSEETAEVRLNGASDEMAAAWRYYNHMVINDDLEQAVNEVIQIIEGS